jgi:mercuric ion transport protein
MGVMPGLGNESKVGSMSSSRPGTAVATPAANLRPSERVTVERQRLVVLGGIVGALAASSCCIVPVILFSLGISGAWIANLTALAPYKPLFVTGTAGLLGYGFYLVYWKPSRACAEGEACARPLPSRAVKLGLWTALVLVAVAYAFDYVAPLLFGA